MGFLKSFDFMTIAVIAMMLGFIFFIGGAAYSLMENNNCLKKAEDIAIVSSVDMISAGGWGSQTQYLYQTNRGQIISTQMVQPGEKIVLGCD
jgi:hypothetical protein